MSGARSLRGRYALPGLLAAGALVWSAIGDGPARAHVAPALDANNRYLRITPMRDRIRLAYTVYIGERPGRDERRRMDRDGDGAVSASEAEAYGRRLAAAVAPGLELSVNGAPYPLGWAERHVGLGTPTVRGGSFSVDLIAWLCVGEGASHSAVIVDRYRVPLPGETEVEIRDSPGIEVTRAGLGADSRAIERKLEWRGAGGPLATLGLYLEYTVDDQRADRPPGDHCDPGRGGEREHRRNWPVLLALALLALAGLGWFVRRRARSARPRMAALADADADADTDTAASPTRR